MAQGVGQASRESQKGAHVAVIGGGQSCRWLLFAFSGASLRSDSRPAVARITIIERRHMAGVGSVGLVWRDDALAGHLPTFPMPVSRSAYSGHNRRSSTEPPMPRVGVTVDLWLGQEVTAVRRCREGYALATAAGRTLAADIVVLAMGHGAPSAPSRVPTGFGRGEGPRHPRLALACPLPQRDPAMALRAEIAAASTECGGRNRPADARVALGPCHSAIRPSRSDSWRV